MAGAFEEQYYDVVLGLISTAPTVKGPMIAIKYRITEVNLGKDYAPAPWQPGRGLTTQRCDFSGAPA
jgi:hypothetical protein